MSDIIRLLDRGRLDEAEELVRPLRAAYPSWGFADILGRMFERLPMSDARQTPFSDDLNEEIQIATREGADSVLLVFCGFDHKLGFSLSVVHRWLGRLPASVVYLRDFRSLFFLGGLPSLGADMGATIAALRDICAALGRRIFCCGCSGGLFASLHFGLCLGAEAVLALSGPTNVSTGFNARLRSARRVAHLHATLPELTPIDLRKTYAASAHPPRVLITYDRNNWDDRLHAEYLAGLPTVRLDPLDGRGVHAIIAELMARGLFEERLDWLHRA